VVQRSGTEAVISSNDTDIPMDERPRLNLDWSTSRLAIQLFSRRDPAGRRWRRHEVGSILDEKKIMEALHDTCLHRRSNLLDVLPSKLHWLQKMRYLKLLIRSDH
jgi:hypothetical protein